MPDNPVDTSNFPQEALKFIAEIFDEGVKKFGDANKCVVPLVANLKIAKNHLDNLPYSEENSYMRLDDAEKDHISKAICRLLLALNKSILNESKLHPIECPNCHYRYSLSSAVMLTGEYDGSISEIKCNRCGSNLKVELFETSNGCSADNHESGLAFITSLIER